MTFDPKPSEDTVRQEASHYGYNDTLVNSLPKELSVESFGDTSASIDETGANLSSGSTAGDNIRIVTPDMIFGQTGLAVHRFQMLLRINRTTPTNPQLQVGLLQDAWIDDSNGPYFDFKDEVFRDENEGEIPFNHSPDTAIYYHLFIELDYFNDVSTVFLVSEDDPYGPVLNEQFSTTAGDRFRYSLRMESTGSGQEVNVLQQSETWVPASI